MNYLITPLLIFFAGGQGLGKVHQGDSRQMAKNTTREKPIHRILPAALPKIPRYYYLAAARVRETRCWQENSSSASTTNSAPAIIAMTSPPR